METTVRWLLVTIGMLVRALFLLIFVPRNMTNTTVLCLLLWQVFSRLLQNSSISTISDRFSLSASLRLTIFAFKIRFLRLLLGLNLINTLWLGLYNRLDFWLRKSIVTTMGWRRAFLLNDYVELAVWVCCKLCNRFFCVLLLHIWRQLVQLMLVVGAWLHRVMIVNKGEKLGVVHSTRCQETASLYAIGINHGKLVLLLHSCQWVAQSWGILGHSFLQRMLFCACWGATCVSFMTTSHGSRSSILVDVVSAKRFLSRHRVVVMLFMRGKTGDLTTFRVFPVCSFDLDIDLWWRHQLTLSFIVVIDRASILLFPQ